MREIAELNAGAQGLGSIGAVLGATRDRPEFELGDLRGTFLVPGVGAQGASPADVGSLFERCAKGSVIVNVARALSAAGPDRRAITDGAQRWRDDLTAHLP
jgi:orotidine-5'-phosphate decarboxylase